MEFTTNSMYTLSVDCIQELSDGRKYIFFQEMFNGRQLRVKALDFLSQPDADCPSTIDVVVNNIDVCSGMPLFKIDRNWIINTLYKKEEAPLQQVYSFNIVKKIKQENYQCLLIKDSYGVTHYFPVEGDDSLENYSEGEHITLLVDAIKENSNGGLYLSLTKLKPRYVSIVTPPDTEPATDRGANLNPLPLHASGANYGDETETVEFKQSLVFHPKSSTVDVDSQIYNIMRSIAGFMNHIGGTLYIGVRNNGTPNGIANDFTELNKGTNDSYGNYTCDWDGWNRLLIDSVRKYLGTFAATLVNVEKIEENGVIVAKIIIAKSGKPIYVNNKILYRRQCNTTAMLTGDELTWFIIERLRGEALEQFIEQKFGYDTEVADTADVDVENIPVPTENITDGAIEDERNHNKWLYLRLFKDGKYILTSLNARAEVYNEAELVCDFQLEQYHKNEKQILLLIYNDEEEGKVNNIDFAERTNDWYSSAMQARQSNAPWSGDDKKVVVKCVERNDMLVAFYQDKDGGDWCYVRDVLDINPSHADRTKALFTGGHRMMERGSKLSGEIMHIPGAYRNWIAPIVNKHIDLSDSKKKGTIRRLIDILKDIYPNSVLAL